VAFVPIATTAKVELLWTFEGSKKVVNVLHAFDISGAPNVNSIQALAEAVWTACTAGPHPIITQMNHLMVLNAVRATDLSSITGVQFQTAHAGAAGGDAGDALPPSLAVVCKLLTALRSRRGRGRIFWGGVNKDSIDANGFLKPDWQAAYAEAVLQIQSSMLALVPSWDLAVASKKTGTSERVTGIQAETIIRSQRRREMDH
jgi:hypothetical protein